MEHLYDSFRAPLLPARTMEWLFLLVCASTAGLVYGGLRGGVEWGKKSTRGGRGLLPTVVIPATRAATGACLLGLVLCTLPTLNVSWLAEMRMHSQDTVKGWLKAANIIGTSEPDTGCVNKTRDTSKTLGGVPVYAAFGFVHLGLMCVPVWILCEVFPYSAPPLTFALVVDWINRSEGYST